MTYITNNYPTSIQTAVDPTATDQVATFDHAGLETFQNDSIDALKAKVGVDSSAVTTSHDYKLGEVTGSDKAVGKTATQALTNKTLTAPKFVTGGFIADENGNEQIEFATTASAVNYTKLTNSATGNAPAIEAGGSDSNIDLALKGKGTGKVKLGAVGIKFPNADGSANQVMVTDGSGNLSFATPSATDPSLIAPYTVFNQFTGSSTEFVYNQYCDATQFALATASTVTLFYGNSTVSGGPQSRLTTTDWASSDYISSTVTLGVYLYVLLRDASNNYRVYRYSVSNLAAGGTLMTISGQAFSTTGGAVVVMTSNGTNFYFNYKGGNSANDRVISKYTLSGTTLTYSSDITCGGSNNVTNRLVYVDSSENIYGIYPNIDLGGDNKVRKYNSSGTLQYTTIAFPTSQNFRCVFTFGTANYLEYSVTTNPWRYLVRVFI